MMDFLRLVWLRLLSRAGNRRLTIQGLCRILGVPAAFLVFMLLPEISQACAVCFGDPNSQLTIGAKAGVLFMLGVLGLVLGGIGAATIFFIRRARLLEVQSILKGESKS